MIISQKDKSHYIGIESYNRTIEQIKEIDNVKRQLAKEKGITLIPVPCWWDGTKSRYHLNLTSFVRFDYLMQFFKFSLIATVRLSRPDLLIDEANQNEEGQPIPEDIPPHFFDKQIPQVEGIGEPTTATFFTHTRIDPTSWYISKNLFLSFSLSLFFFILLAFTLFRWMLEKYDGVRAFWNPESKAFYTRQGRKKVMPQEIIDSMPTIFLDGELWYYCLFYFLYLTNYPHTGLGEIISKNP